MFADSAAQPGDRGPLLRLHLIGHMQAFAPDGASAMPAGRKARALLGIVALLAPRPALRGRLAELLWSRRPEEQARASLRQEVHRLMEALGPEADRIIQVTRDHLLLRPGAVWVDVAEVMRASITDPAPLALLEADLLEGLDGLDPGFDMWLTTERERLRDRGRALGEKLLMGQLGPEEAIPAAQRLLQIDRAHEGAWRALMRAHAARGERGMAIQAYDRCRAALADMLDAAPSAETQRVLSEIRGPSANRPARPAAPSAAAPVEPIQPAPSRGGVHVGMLPLALVGGGAAEAELARGLADEITEAVSRIRWAFVVAPASLARFAEGGRDETAIRRTFGLDFLIDGTIHRVGERLRISMRLLDLHRAGHVAWARRFDSSTADRLVLEETVAAAVAAQIDPAMLLAEAARFDRDPVGETTAYALTLRALPLLRRIEPAPLRQAGELLHRAIQHEPDFAPAHGWRAFWHAVMAEQGWGAARDEAAELADRAVRLDPFDPRVLTMAGHARAVILHEPDEAAALNDRALALNPNLAMGWALSAAACVFRGELAEAARRAARYKELAPIAPWAAALDPVLPLIALLRGDFPAAAEAARALAQTSPGSRAVLLVWLAALGHLGRKTHAAALLARLRATGPGVSLAGFEADTPLTREADRQVFAEGLRLAGVAGAS